MINREEALVQIYDRIKENRTILGLKSFKRTPTEPIIQADLPCIFMHEENDIIISHSARGGSGYPAKRVLEVVLELVVDKNTDIKLLYRNVRDVVFTVIGSDPKEYSAIVATNAFINENRTEGPTGYGLPDILGMRLVLDLVYTDNGL
jgi:hypothetical protein